MTINNHNYDHNYTHNYHNYNHNDNHNYDHNYDHNYNHNYNQNYNHNYNRNYDHNYNHNYDYYISDAAFLFRLDICQHSTTWQSYNLRCQDEKHSPLLVYCLVTLNF